MISKPPKTLWSITWTMSHLCYLSASGLRFTTTCSKPRSVNNATTAIEYLRKPKHKKARAQTYIHTHIYLYIYMYTYNQSCSFLWSRGSNAWHFEFSHRVFCNQFKYNLVSLFFTFPYTTISITYNEWTFSINFTFSLYANSLLLFARSKISSATNRAKPWQYARILTKNTTTESSTHVP